VEVLERTDLAMLAVQGPNAIAKTLPLMAPARREAAQELARFSGAEFDSWFVARTGYTGEDGFEIMLPATQAAATWQALVARGIAPAGLGARDTLRLEAGMNLYGNDMDESRHPLESGLAWTVAFEPETRDFIGRSALERAREAGVTPRWSACCSRIAGCCAVTSKSAPPPRPERSRRVRRPRSARSPAALFRRR
jgi:aminomethyltransferase